MSGNGRFDAPRWIWVSLPHATFGVAVADGRVVDAAPIAAWMIGKDERYCAGWLRRKGATIIPLDSAQYVGSDR